ncbi:phosphatidylglycerophosphatase A, partial [Thermodesulfobacteriota bacterium]
MSNQRSDSFTLKESYKKAAFSGKAALLFSSWFGSGLMPKAPGTFGTLAAVPLVIITNYLGAACASLTLIVLIPLAVWVSDISQKLLDKDDPPEVVIDEVAGLLMALFLLPFSWVSLVLGFLFFRTFDILKPFPIGMIDKRVKGGL